MARTYSLVGWDKYQHYGKRESVPWVKLHRDLLTSLAWIKADDLARTVMVGSMALAARYQNAIPLDWTLLQSVLALRCSEKQFMIALRYLADSGFLAVEDSEALEPCSQNASTMLEPIEKSREDEEKNPPKSPKGDEHEKFEAFWKAYPSRGRAPNPRKTASKAFNAAVSKGASPDELIRLAPTAAPAEKHGSEFVPQAATWLNQERWKDAPKPIEVTTSSPDDLWRTRLKTWASSPKPPEQRFWYHEWGTPPHKGGSNIPPAVMAEFDGLDIPPFMRRTA